jgi:hypothetical protein
MKKLWSSQWNYEQKMPHREPLDDYINQGINNETNGWILVGVFDDYEKCGEYLNEFEKQQSEL